MTKNSPMISNAWLLMILFCIIAIISRVMPHPWNATPNLALTIVIGRGLPRKQALLLCLLGILLSDIALAWTQHHSIFGCWTLFTYTGWLAICLSSRSFHRPQLTSQAGFILSASFCFWLWTNIGAWLCSPLYTKTLPGLVTCLTLGLPFLQHALLGDLIWSAFFLFCLRYQQTRHLTATQ